ncbi:NifB/NifX family molybdenum-iron cluster-binding protein [Clostridium polynesiense]|uniref:NifB/NifX family molybdenum-iron cluster-binding protein n=1 Tax=Clostridium polynesiense TaxID=1325933 RepID=UPI00058E6F97|nr:NifB/NifX family molybdenum-iron cluster-binding protein [Clostridium polynesiense]
MKIAVASEGKMVAQHFGHCENFNIYTIDNNEVTEVQSVANPGHKPGYLPNFLNDLGVKVIISGGIGSGAIDIFNEKGIKVVSGADGEAEAAVMKYLQGELISKGSACNAHMHHDSCGE